MNEHSGGKLSLGNPLANMTNHLEHFLSLHSPAILKSLTSSEKLGGKVTNKDLQATMIQALRSMEKIARTEKYGEDFSRDQRKGW
ncbi:hypothetical protein ACFX13_038473 [Malus domestica]